MQGAQAAKGQRQQQGQHKGGQCQRQSRPQMMTNLTDDRSPGDQRAAQIPLEQGGQPVAEAGQGRLGQPQLMAHSARRLCGDIVIAVATGGDAKGDIPGQGLHHQKTETGHQQRHHQCLYQTLTQDAHDSRQGQACHCAPQVSLVR